MGPKLALGISAAWQLHALLCLQADFLNKSVPFPFVLNSVIRNWMFCFQTLWPFIRTIQHLRQIGCPLGRTWYTLETVPSQSILHMSSSLLRAPCFLSFPLSSLSLLKSLLKWGSKKGDFPNSKPPNLVWLLILHPYRLQGRDQARHHLSLPLDCKPQKGSHSEYCAHPCSPSFSILVQVQREGVTKAVSDCRTDGLTHHLCKSPLLTGFILWSTSDLGQIMVLNVSWEMWHQNEGWEKSLAWSFTLSKLHFNRNTTAKRHRFLS